MSDMSASPRAIERRVRQHVLAGTHDFFAVVHPGFETVAQEELAELGIAGSEIVASGGLAFSGRLADCYRVNLSSRTVSRVLMRLCRFKAEHFTRLREKTAAFPWELYLNNTVSLDCSITAIHSRLYHSGRIGEEARQAIAARLAQFGLAAAPAGGDEPAQTIFIRLEDNLVQYSLDSSGELLYKRGMKPNITEAPLRETLAALILREARWREYDLIIDPMCGSGTFSLEAAGMIAGIVPGADRDFIFMRWPAFREKAYLHMKKGIMDGAAPLAGRRVFCSDIDPGAVETARNNLGQAGLLSLVDVSVRDFFEEQVAVPAGKRALLVLNPPYGTRLRGIDVTGLYRTIGETIRARYAGCGYAIITPNIACEKALALPYARKVPFMHGGIQVALLLS